MRPARSTRFAIGLAALAVWASSSCAPTGFQNGNVINSVRILASSSDKPYAKPGDTVTTEVLADDARPSKPEPMTIYWLTNPCMNPANDAYYGCFSGGFDPGQVTAASSLAFTMPLDAISKHPVVPGSVASYGLAILFNIACAGHLELVPLDPNNVQSPPVGCFDMQHNRLSAPDYVFGFTRVYAYADLPNHNPSIESVDLEGTSLALDTEMTTPVVDFMHCTGSCPSKHIGPVVPASSQEADPASHDTQGNELKEQIWAEYFSTLGTFSDDVRLLYDSATGSLGTPGDTDDKYTPPGEPGDGFIWIVVHDNRGGATWATIPVHVE